MIETSPEDLIFQREHDRSKALLRAQKALQAAAAEQRETRREKDRAAARERTLAKERAREEHKALTGDGEKAEAEDEVTSTAGVTQGDAAVERAKTEAVEKAGSAADGSTLAGRQEDQVMSPRGKAAVKATICKYCRKTFACAMGRNGHLRHCKKRLAIQETRGKEVEVLFYSMSCVVLISAA